MWRLGRKSTEEKDTFYLECEKHWVFWTLIVVGGYYGAYTFSVRGGVFCNAQTANVVMMALAIGNRDVGEMLYLLIPISAYFFGAVLSEFLGKKVKTLKKLRWDTILVGFEIPVVFFLGALPESAPDQICQVALNFICSMQFNTFRQNQGIPMATTFVTNHIRQFGSNLVKAVRDHEREASIRWKMHLSMIILFLLGGILSTILCRHFGVRAIWGSIPLLVFTFIRLMIADLTYEKELLSMKPRGH